MREIEEVDRGAHYFRTDLQVHSPRDRAWKGERPTSPAEREEFARAFVAACRERELSAVAITDHHDFAFVDYIRSAATTERDSEGQLLPAERQLVVFPGLELTLPVPCQALLILDADFPSDRLSSVLERLGIDAADNELAQHSEPQQLPDFDSLQKLHERLNQSDWLRHSYAVFPNVSDSGQHTLLRPKLHRRYAEMPCVGGYVDGPASKLGTGNTSILAGKDQKWGNKRVAVIQTSDSRNGRFDSLGKHSTWIKWAAPTAEALRQACLAQESRVSLEKPELPRVWVTRLSVSNSSFMGRVDLDLNPQYTALIGGRGTGKSTCLGYLRWALCDRPRAPGNNGNGEDVADTLIERTLRPVGGSVEVHFRLNDVPHVVRRQSEDGTVAVKVGTEDFVAAEPDDIRSLLAIEAYGQRQLSTVGVRVDQLSRFVEAPIRAELNSIDNALSDLSASVEANAPRIQRQRVLEHEVERDAVTIASLQQQAEQLRSEMHGLAETDRSTLDRKAVFDESDQAVDAWLRKVEQAQQTLNRAESNLTALRDGFPAVPTGIQNEAQLAKLAERLEAVLSAAHSDLEAAARRTRAAVSEHETSALLDNWRKHRSEFDAQYEAARGRATDHQERLGKRDALDEQRAKLAAIREAKREELSALGDPGSIHRSLLSDWRSAQGNRSAALEAQCERLGELSNGLIRASVQRSIDGMHLIERIRTLTTGSGVRRARIEAFVHEVAEAEHPLVTWHESLDDLNERVMAGPERAAELEVPSTALRVFPPADLLKIVEKLKPADVIGLMLERPDDRPHFEYRVKEGQYIDFSVASAGQQATALLGVLLQQAGPPLVIDQPEDDLDSEVIFQVVHRIWQAKHRRQLIFASHNANLVVNGDAELVACCDYVAANDHSAGEIALRGAIDIPEVRDKITLIMEGGERAFRLRQEKYGF